MSNVDKHSRDGEAPVRLCNYVDVYKHDRITERLSFMRATASVSEIRRCGLRVGDVVITKDSESWNDIGVPALVEYMAPDLICGYHLAILRPRRSLVLGGYLHRALQSPGVAYQFHVAATGVTRYGLTHGAIKSNVLPVPPLAEQAAIVRYLDYIDRRIGRAIRAKTRLVALLEEQKQDIIHRAVTRGLDPDAPLKPSGVEWLGDVPAHWAIRRLGQIARSFRTGPFGSVLHQADFVEGGIPIVNPTHMRNGTIVEDARCTVPTSVAERLPQYRMDKDDLVFARRGDLGRCALVRDREVGWLCGTGSILVRIHRDGLLPEYLVLALQERWVGEYLSLYSVGATMDSLNTQILKGLPLLLPPYHEQQQVLAHITHESRHLDRAAALQEREIALLREYRTRLIADVVTGAVDVRAAAAALPDQPPEDELEEIADLEDLGEAEEETDMEAVLAEEE